jgi:hypothetical protein
VQLSFLQFIVPSSKGFLDIAASQELLHNPASMSQKAPKRLCLSTLIRLIHLRGRELHLYSLGAVNVIDKCNKRRLAGREKR